MTKQEIIAFLNKNPACHLATSVDGQPHVRGMLMYRADETGIIFHTGNMKDLSRDLLANPKVEICFNDLQAQIQVRVRGVATQVDSQQLKEEIVANRPFMQPWVKAQGYGMLAVFKIINCQASTWTFATNFAPKEWLKLD